ncbi:MAG: hypothetical protein QXT86_12510 [Archaeoglobaceae archaeon]
MRKRNWIQEAIKNPGSFTAYCKRKGHKGVTEECIRQGLKSSNPTVRRRARLAKTLRKLRRRRKR